MYASTSERNVWFWTSFSMQNISEQFCNCGLKVDDIARVRSEIDSCQLMVVDRAESADYTEQGATHSSLGADQSFPGRLVTRLSWPIAERNRAQHHICDDNRSQDFCPGREGERHG